tara:strand:- start:301 stop:699 length:399 start_codon:yes stop_codon:yes gene_type:complete
MNKQNIKRTLEGSEIAGSSKKQMVFSTRQLNALRKLKNWHNEFTGIFDPKSGMEELKELCKDASIEYTIYINIYNDVFPREEKWIEYDKNCETIQTFMRMEKMEKDKSGCGYLKYLKKMVEVQTEIQQVSKS